MQERWISRSEAETIEIGKAIAAKLPENAVVYLSGDLGAGKTTLVRASVTELGADPLEVASPSFALVHEYLIAGRSPILHIDGYRLSDNRREWMEIGIDDLLLGPGLKFIEWPKRHFDELGGAHAEIEIRVEPDESRTIVMTFQPS
ncbi:MAG TPA: tRNA (adenosine(37)-N6)-threonylcarbamoyltransferase complex ATPase subunit type 1 TsaE [Thermoanaerobaculia bacterium]|nr:tRNA (adenosine(37)-N6)-threonylcarbamoyltransferase complex ATPase subunit type 1 TsaE [Thermoanaerobaculia bacterium]